jgi:hypothetical protein
MNPDRETAAPLRFAVVSRPVMLIVMRVENQGMISREVSVDIFSMADFDYQN